MVARMHIVHAQCAVASRLAGAGYARLGQLEEAGAEAADVLRINPAFTIESWKCTTPFKDPKDLEHLVDRLRRARRLLAITFLTMARALGTDPNCCRSHDCSTIR